MIRPSQDYTAIVLLCFFDLKIPFIATQQTRLILEMLFCMATAIHIIW